MPARTVSILAFLAVSAGGAAAQCEANFRQEGVPLVTGITYRTTTTLRMAPAAALKGLASAVAAEGFHGIRVDSALGAISAFQETTGLLHALDHAAQRVAHQIPRGDLSGLDEEGGVHPCALAGFAGHHAQGLRSA